MNPSRSIRLSLLAGLALLMLATRFHHFLEVPDASWAIFFAAGFYLAGMTRWAFPLLMVEAVLIDWFATRHLGVTAYCLTPAYAFLVPTHAMLWLGGFWMRRRAGQGARGAACLALSAFVSVSLAFAISNGSFYWLSGVVAAPTFAKYVPHFFDYYAHFLAVPCVYIAAAAVIHVGVTTAVRARTNRDLAQP
ncbi:MAG: hypothetical protein ACT4P0_10180 [Panacagrimonas sp.]